MTHSKTIERVRNVNPLPVDPSPPAVEPLLVRLDTSVRSLEQAWAQAPSRPLRPRVLPRFALGLAGATALALALGAFALIGGPGAGRLDVAAAFYRATTPGSGVQHTVTLTEISTAEHTTVTRGETFSAQNPRRQRVLVGSGSAFTEASLSASAGATAKTLRWTQGQPGVIHEGTAPAAEQQTPVDFLREAYRAGRLHVIGRGTLHGRPVWRLSIQVRGSTLDGELPLPTVLVDAHTFVPLEVVSHSVLGNSDHSELETTRTRYVTYEQLAATASVRGQLVLASHPGAKFVAE